MQELLIAFIQTPGQETFHALRSAVAASDDYQPYDSYREQLYALLEHDRYAEARELLRAKMVGWLLNPGIHLHMMYVCHKLDDEDSADAERYIGSAILRGILDSGDGSRERPYLVMRTADEYDLLEYLGKTPQGQELVQEPERVLDHLLCADGAGLWFDISLPFGRLRQSTQLP
jgi:hypothetical protein